jgi:hypothetical protein
MIRVKRIQYGWSDKMVVNGASEPDFWTRLWSKLGYGMRVPEFNDQVYEDEANGRWAAGHLVIESAAVLDWPDRLRILFSGKLGSRLHVKTTSTIDRALTVSEVYALRPDYEL